MNKIRILLADDHAVVRIGLSALLKTEPDFEIVGEADNGETAVALAARLRPDVLLLDLVMPVKDGIATTAEVRAAAPEVHVLILTSFGDPDGIARALEAGAVGAVLKTAPEGDILAAIREAAAGHRVLSDEIRHTLAEAHDETPLTPRQREILASVIQGRTNRQIGMEIGIREDSVAEHLSALYAKLGAANRAQAIAIALRRQLLKV